MAADRAGEENGTRAQRSDARAREGGLGWLPDLAAVLAGIAGAVAFEDAARWLCGIGGFVALVRFGARVALVAGGDRRVRAESTAPDRDGRRLRSVVAALPALLLLIGIVLVSRPDAPGSAPFASAPSASAPPTIRVDDVPPAARDCLENAAVKTYLDALYRHLDATWQARAASAEGGFVVLGFLLDAQGGVRLSRVIDRSSDAYRDAGTATLGQAAPFGPLAGELACLGAIELRATLDRTSPR